MNPISAVTTALRDLFGNAPVPEGAAWPVAHPVAGSLAWCLALIAVCAPLAARRPPVRARQAVTAGC